MTQITDIEIIEDLKRACDVMRRGGVIIYPTDTIWGIGCDATNSSAVKRVFEIKKRDDAKALITLVDSPSMLTRYVDGIPEVAYQLIEFSQKPLTIVYDKGVGLAKELLGVDGSVGVRLTRELYSASLCRMLKHPIVSTSANISGEPAPINFADISNEIIGAVDYVASYRRNDIVKATPSSVMKLSVDGTFKIIRP